MKSIKLMFLMFVIGMITFTSCSETEQLESKKTKIETKKETPEEESQSIIQDEVAGTNTAERKAKILCMKSIHQPGSLDTTYYACVNVNGNLYFVDLLYHDGILISSHAFASPKCNC